MRRVDPRLLVAGLVVVFAVGIGVGYLLGNVF
jgi:hypothetical protein